VLKDAKKIQKDVESHAPPPPEAPVALPDGLELPPVTAVARDPREFLLIENPTISRLYKTLVDGIVSGPEFWENFKTELIRHDIDPSRQQPGYSSAILSNISPDESGKVNEVKYVITPAAVAQIFRKKPQVARKYAAWVHQHRNNDYPGAIAPEDDAEFWSQYIKNASRQVKGAKSQNQEPNIFSSMKMDDTVAFDSVAKLRRCRSLEPAVIAGWMHESFAGSGVLNKDELPPADSKVIDAINMHSQLVLIEIGVVPDITSRSSSVVPAPLPDVSVSEDLTEQRPTVLKPLKVAQKPASQIDASDSTVGLAEATALFAAEVGDYASAFSRLPVAPQITEQDSECVLREMTRSDGFGYDFGRMNEESDFLKEQLEQIRQFKLEQQTLLFLYWRMMETPTEAHLATAEKLKMKLQELEQAVERNRPRMASVPPSSPDFARLQQAAEVAAPLYDEMKALFAHVCGAPGKGTRQPADDDDVNLHFDLFEL
jgi:hypothetical protein